MIVLHGVAGIAEEVTEYTISADNKNYEVVYGADTLHDSAVLLGANSMSKVDGTSIGGGATIKIKIKTSNVSTISIAGGHCEVSMNTLSPVADVGSLTKDLYIAEMHAFIDTGRVDFSLSGIGYESPIDGAVFGTWASDSPVGGLPFSGVTIEQTAENEFILEYNTKDILGDHDDCDWYVASLMRIKINIVTKSGAIVAEEELVYYNEDAPITSCVSTTKGRYLTFDSGVATIGGWWESADVPARRRYIAAEEMGTRDSMFKYLIFGSISPKVFSTKIRNMVFTASRSGDLYVMDKVLSNNMYEFPSGLEISSAGPGLVGSASIISHPSLGTISVDTSDAHTEFGEMHVEIFDSLSSNLCKFQIKSGHSPSENFIGAAANSVIVYNQITGRGPNVHSQTNSDNMLVGFHLMLSGFQNLFIEPWTDPAFAVFGMMGMGILCIFGGNIVEFTFFLYYEQLKWILYGAESRMKIHNINQVQEHYLSSMALTQKGVDASTRKKIARQWLEMTRYDYMRVSGPTVERTFILRYLCAIVPMRFPDHIPYTLGLPMYGVPIEENIVDSASTENNLMTDVVESMMRKNAQYTLYRTRMDWAMSTNRGIARRATYWAWGGTLITIIRDGVNQELYSVDDPAYALNSTSHTSGVSIPGEIGEAWNEHRAHMIPVVRWVYWNKYPVVYEDDANTAIRDWANNATPVLTGLVRSMVIDVDNNQVSIDGGTSIDAIIKKPNKDLLLAFKKSE